jgi:hypothetical protein
MTQNYLKTSEWANCYFIFELVTNVKISEIIRNGEHPADIKCLSQG